MSTVKKLAIVTLVIAAFSQCSATEAKADPFSKLFAKAGEKAVGGIYKSVGKNVSQSSRLILKTAPYALLQGSRSRASRPNPSSNSFQGLGLGATNKLIQGKATTGNRTGSWKNVLPRKSPARSSGSFNKPIYFGSRFRR